MKLWQPIRSLSSFPTRLERATSTWTLEEFQTVVDTTDDAYFLQQPFAVHLYYYLMVLFDQALTQGKVYGYGSTAFTCPTNLFHLQHHKPLFLVLKLEQDHDVLLFLTQDELRSKLCMAFLQVEPFDVYPVSSLLRFPDQEVFRRDASLEMGDSAMLYCDHKPSTEACVKAYTDAQVFPSQAIGGWGILSKTFQLFVPVFEAKETTVLGLTLQGDMYTLQGVYSLAQARAGARILAPYGQSHWLAHNQNTVETPTIGPFPVFCLCLPPCLQPQSSKQRREVERLVRESFTLHVGTVQFVELITLKDKTTKNPFYGAIVSFVRWQHRSDLIARLVQDAGVGRDQTISIPVVGNDDQHITFRLYRKDPRVQAFLEEKAPASTTIRPHLRQCIVECFRSQTFPIKLTEFQTILEAYVHKHQDTLEEPFVQKTSNAPTFVQLLKLCHLSFYVDQQLIHSCNEQAEEKKEYSLDQVREGWFVHPQTQKQILQLLASYPSPVLLVSFPECYFKMFDTKLNYEKTIKRKPNNKLPQPAFRLSTLFQLMHSHVQIMNDPQRVQIKSAFF